MEEEDEDEGHVHGDDGDHHQHAAVQGGHHPAQWRLFSFVECGKLKDN